MQFVPLLANNANCAIIGLKEAISIMPKLASEHTCALEYKNGGSGSCGVSISTHNPPNRNILWERTPDCPIPLRFPGEDTKLCLKPNIIAWEITGAELV